MNVASAKFKEFLRARRLRNTRERSVILDEVMRLHTHFEPEDIVMRLRRRGKGISRASVYRTMALLVDAGIVRKTPCDQMPARYEHVLGHNHHDHLVCTGCGRIIEFHDEKIERRQREVARRRGFRMTGHRLVISGYCKACEAQMEDSKKRP
jgi:Fur family ferric uptake transcriptional regulator